MPKGIEILSTMKCDNYPSIWELIFIAILLLLLALLVGLFIVMSYPFYSEYKALTISTAIVWIVFMLLVNTIISHTSGEWVEYKVKIDKDTKFLDVHSKYEVLDIEGEIYTIQEK